MGMDSMSASQRFHAKVKPLWYLVWATLSQTGMSFVQQGIIVLGFIFARKYHLDFAQIGLVTTSMSLGVMVSMIFMGILADNLGPKRLLSGASVVMSAFALLLVTAHGFHVLLIMFFFLGSSLAAVPMSGTKAVFSAFQGRARGTPMGIRQTGGPIGAALAALLLPLLAMHAGLNTVYIIFAVELLTVGWIFSAVIPPFTRPSRKAGEVKAHPRAGLKELWQPAVVSILMVSGQYFLVTFTLEYLHRFRHFSLAEAGMALALAQIGGGVGRVLFGLVSDRAGSNRPRTISLVALLAAVMVVVIAILPVHTAFGWICVVWFFTGMGTIGWNALSLTWAAESVPAVRAGFAMGFVGTVVFFGSALFPPLLGAVIDSTHHFHPAWMILAAILACAGLVAHLSGRATKRMRKERPV
jgi:MFS family permease